MLNWRRTLIGLCVTLPLLALVFLRIDLDQTRDVLADADYPLLLLAMVAFALSVSFQAARWWFLVRRVADVSMPSLYPVLMIGQMGNALLPLRGGDIMRVLMFGRGQPVDRTLVLGTIAVERILDALVLCVFVFIFIIVHDSSVWLRDLAVVSGLFVGLAVAVLAFAILWHERAIRLLSIVIDRTPLRWQPLLRKLTASFVQGLRTIDSPWVLLGVLLTTLAFWLSIVSIYDLVGHAFGLDVGLEGYLLATAVGNLSLSVPSSQGGLGPFEFSVKQALVLLGAAPEAATAYAIGLHVLLILPVVVLGLVFLWTQNISLDDLLKRREAAPAGSEAIASSDDAGPA